MIDFIVSKVAMSVCALLVVSLLGGILEDNALLRNADELDSVINDLSTIIDVSAMSGCESDIVWRVPFLSNGENIEIVIGHSAVTARAGLRSAMTTPACEPHTWIWNGSALNRSSLGLLDANASPLRTSSGSSLEIQTRAIPFENQDAILVFVGPVG